MTVWTTPVHLSDALGAAILADTPKGYWKLDTAFGDWSGNNHFGQGFGGFTFAPGAYSNACFLDGSTGYITVADHADLDTSDIVTLEAWVKPTTATGIMSIIDKSTLSYFIRLNAGFLEAGKQDVAVVVGSTVAVPIDGAWHHVVWTKTGATNKLYIDGVDRTGAVANQTLANNAVEVRIGQRASFGGGGQFFNGGLDEVAIYATALSSARVTAHFNARATGTGAPTTATWNPQVADNLTFLREGKGFYFEGVVDDRSINLSSQTFNGWFVPIICRDLITVSQVAYRGNSAGGHFDLGIYQDDGNEDAESGHTCSALATSGITLVPAGSGAHAIALDSAVTLQPLLKYWLAVSWEAAGASISGTDGPAAQLTKIATNVYPLTVVVKFSTQTPTRAPYLAALP